MCAAPTKIVKGGFRSTLALIVSVVALVFSIMAYNRTSTQTTVQTDIKELKEKLVNMKQETAERIGKISQETATAIKKIGTEIEKQTEKSKDAPSQ